MTSRSLLTAFILAVIAGPAAALSPLVPHENPPPREAVPEVLIAQPEPVPFYEPVPYCSFHFHEPIVDVRAASPKVEIEVGLHPILYVQDPAPALTPIQTTPIQ